VLVEAKRALVCKERNQRWSLRYLSEASCNLEGKFLGKRKTWLLWT